MKILKYDIQLKTFFKKGVKKIDDSFGVYFVTGKQGSGKTYYAVKLANSQPRSKFLKLYTNIHSLNIPGFDIEYFTKLDQIYFNTTENCLFIIDEVSRKYKRDSKTDQQFYAWLNQCRKRKRIVILITQEWRELPMWIRRPAKFSFSTNKVLWGRLFITSVGDAENMVYDRDEGEYLCPTVKKVVYKRNKVITELYDTFEPINEL